MRSSLNEYFKRIKSKMVFYIGDDNVTFEPRCRNNWHIYHNGG
ncbi:hypothetical protein [Mycoplasma sp. P36-A1]